MYNYSVTVHYRKRPLVDGETFEDPEFWDGQNRVDVESDVAIDESFPGDINAEIKNIVRSIGKENGYTAVALARHASTGAPWIEHLDGDSFFSGGGE